jgi:hypothetical protein
MRVQIIIGFPTNCLEIFSIGNSFCIFFKYFFGVPHLATFISFSNVIAGFAYTIQYMAPGFEPTTTQL